MSQKKICSGVAHEVPADLKKVLASDALALAAWEDITPLARNEWICWIESARKAETRSRRIEWGCANLKDVLLARMRPSLIPRWSPRTCDCGLEPANFWFARNPASDRFSDHPHNCKCRIIGLVLFGEVIHGIEDQIDEIPGVLRALRFGPRVLIHLYENVMLIQQPQNDRIEVGYAVHHMTPVAPHRFQIQ